MHVILYGLLAVILAGGLFLAATQLLPAGEQIAPPLRDEPPWDLPPDRDLHADDVDTVRLPVALRGYRFAETDLLLDRLAGELRARDEEIARLRGAPAQRHAAVELGSPAGPRPEALDDPVALAKARFGPPSEPSGAGAGAGADSGADSASDSGADARAGAAGPELGPGAGARPSGVPDFDDRG